MSESELESWLDAASFDADPDAWLGDAEVASDDEFDRRDSSDPWADRILDVGGLTAEQRSFVDVVSPSLGAALVSGTLNADAPFSQIGDAAIDDADSVVIDFDDDDETGSTAHRN